jgi:hypothetical protein
MERLDVTFEVRLVTSLSALVVRAVSIVGTSSSSLPRTSPTMLPWILIYAPSSTPWRVLCHHRSDQLAHVYTKHVLKHAPTTDRASDCRSIAPMGHSAATLGPHLSASNAPSEMCTSLVIFCRCIDSCPAPMPPLRGVGLLHTVTFVVPANQHPRIPPRRLLGVGCRLPSTHGLRHAAGFFLAYFDYHRRASTGYAYGHFQPLSFLPTTPSTPSTMTSSPASSPRPWPHMLVYSDNRGLHRDGNIF